MRSQEVYYAALKGEYLGPIEEVAPLLVAEINRLNELVHTQFEAGVVLGKAQAAASHAEEPAKLRMEVQRLETEVRRRTKYGFGGEPID